MLINIIITREEKKVNKNICFGIILKYAENVENNDRIGLERQKGTLTIKQAGM